ncbi:hypothetical protein LEMLEM_LOCUS15821 [Lemmus lemmus]
MKHHEQKQLGRERVYFPQFHHHQKRYGQELKQGSVGDTERGPWALRQALGEPGMLSTQGCSFKGRNVKPDFCPEGWSGHAF